MSNKDIGNTTTQTMYELAKQPIFIDRSQEPQQEISWEVSGEEEIPLPPQLEETKEEPIPSEDKEEIHEEPQSTAEPEVEEETEELEKKKKRNRTSEKSRISQLTRELRQAQSIAHDVLSRNQYLESKISQKEKEAFTTQENYLTSQKERVKKYLTDAIEEGDPSKIAEANDLLSQYNAEILLLNRQKESFQTNSSHQNSHQQSQHSYEEPIEAPYQEIGKEWMDKNSWANPKSPHFDQEMYEEADNYSVRLARKYKLEGRGDEVGTSDFFDEITDYIKHSYDISIPPPSSKPQQRERMQMKTDQSPPVGAVTRQSPLNQTPQKSKDIVLTPEQREIAHSLRGFIKNPKTGQRVEDNKTLEEIYKRNLMKGNG